jgi:vancomycin resistance protein YoaR
MRKSLLYFLVALSFFFSVGAVSQDIIGSEILGSYETSFHYSGEEVIRNRARNVRRALEKLNGAVIQPGKRLSYNRTLGPRIAERGWRPAKTILNGEIVIDYGGGICQVSSTLHAAAIQSGLLIVNAQHHSRYMSYISPGLDATVSWPNLDLVIQNPYSFPVRIHAWESHTGIASVEFIGAQREWDVEISHEIIERRRFHVESIERSDMPTSYRHVLEKGTNFLVLNRVIVSTSRITGEIFIESERMQYESSPRIIEIGTAPESM